jgi:hypothetical protein
MSEPVYIVGAIADDQFIGATHEPNPITRELAEAIEKVRDNAEVDANPWAVYRLMRVKSEAEESLKTITFEFDATDDQVESGAVAPMLDVLQALRESAAGAGFPVRLVADGEEVPL